MKSAKEMFKLLGYEYCGNDNSIMYVSSFVEKEMWHLHVVVFNKIYKEWNIFENINNVSVGIELHKAITKQMEELGWLE